MTALAGPQRSEGPSRSQLMVDTADEVPQCAECGSEALGQIAAFSVGCLSCAAVSSYAVSARFCWEPDGRGSWAVLPKEAD